MMKPITLLRLTLPITVGVFASNCFAQSSPTAAVAAFENRIFLSPTQAQVAQTAPLPFSEVTSRGWMIQPFPRMASLRW